MRATTPVRAILTNTTAGCKAATENTLSFYKVVTRLRLAPGTQRIAVSYQKADSLQES